MESENLEGCLSELLDAFEAGDASIKSQGVIEHKGRKIIAAHLVVLGQEYVLSLVPTDLDG